jgi:exosortase
MKSISETSETLSPSARHILFGLFSAALVLLANAPIRQLIKLSMNLGNSHLSYIGLIPFISAALIYFNRRAIFSTLESSFLPAALMFAAGGAGYFLGYTRGLRINENDSLTITTSAVIVFWLGGFLLAYGFPAFKAALFPLLFLAFAVPIPLRVLNGFVLLLQRGSAELVSILFTLTGTPVYRSSTFVFDLAKVSIQVAEECSGIRSTLGMIIVTFLAAHMVLRSNWRRAVLLLTVIPFALLKNAVRIVTLTLLAVHVDMGFLTGKLHGEGGILFMAIGLVLMYPVLAFLAKPEAKTFDSGVRL